MHRQVSVLLVALSGLFPILSPVDLAAQDTKDGPKDDGRGTFFKKAVPTSDIDFWGTGAKKKEADAATRKKTVGGKDLYETIFAEPVQMPDGRYAVYVPPRAVLEFLENPTKESARGYLDWQSTRSRKIATALELLEAVKREEAVPTLDAGIEKGTRATDEKADRRAQDKSRTRSTRDTAPLHAEKTQGSKTKAKIRLTYFRQAG